MFTDSNQPHIAVVGRRNVGKSLLVNLLLGQNIAAVSEIAGTTTNAQPTKYELLPYGPVVIVDTAGIDDEGELGHKKVTETIKVLSVSDFVLLVVDARTTLQSKELELLAYLDKLQINYIVAVNKIEFGVNPDLLDELKELRITHFEVSCKEKAGIEELKRKITRLLPFEAEQSLFNDILSQGNVIVAVTPNAPGAPKGKLILTQIQTIREALDKDTIVIICKDKEFQSTLSSLKKYPDLVITDEHTFVRVAADIPESVNLTTFSILAANQKADLSVFLNGLKRFDELQNNDKVLIADFYSGDSENEDSTTVKITRWLQNHSRKDLQIIINHGQELPENLSEYKLIIHCDECMLTRREIQTRINEARLLDVPIVSYGLLTSYMFGSIPRALIPFKGAINEWEKIKVK